MALLSLVIITFNESARLADCILSAADIADEILVVDSFSTDDTREIAASLGARVITHPFEGHIQQKNFAMESASHDWILSLDADERLDDTLREEIRKVMQNPEHRAYRMNRLNNYCGKWIRHGGWYPDTKTRLWNRRFGRWGGLNPHDKVIMNGEQALPKLRGNILHYSYATKEEHVQKSIYFSGIAAQAYFDSGKRSSWLRIWLNPTVKFFKEYFLKYGFLDGAAGLHIARMNAKETRMKYRKLLEIQKIVPR